jgi:hypothetical protein
MVCETYRHKPHPAYRLRASKKRCAPAAVIPQNHVVRETDGACVYCDASDGDANARHKTLRPHLRHGERNRESKKKKDIGVWGVPDQRLGEVSMEGTDAHLTELFVHHRLGLHVDYVLRYDDQQSLGIRKSVRGDVVPLSTNIISTRHVAYSKFCVSAPSQAAASRTVSAEVQFRPGTIWTL